MTTIETTQIQGSTMTELVERLAAMQSRLADTQAGLTIWMERSKANAREFDAAYDAMCDIAQMLDCAEDWPAIKAALALLAVAA